MKYYIVAGEASGDMHASNLMKGLKCMDTDAIFRFWGGDLMAAVAGIKPEKHYKDLACMGFAEVLMNLSTILKNLKKCKSDISKFHPDALILVDYPGFNLRIAEYAHNLNIKVIYYISPQIWAWKESRIHKIKKFVDKMLVILPFEKDFYLKHKYSADYVGHPLLDSLEPILEKSESATKKKIAIVPGSRVQEIERMLPVMLEATDSFGDYEIVIAASNHIDENIYKKIIGTRKVKIIFNNLHDAVKNSDAALVTSGTATLETALLGIPQLVCYKANLLSYFIAKKLVKVKFISLVNLILDKEVVKELIQNEMNVANVKRELTELLYNDKKRQTIKDSYMILYKNLGGKGASERASKIIINFLTNSK